jgi:hypothetical protein
MCGSERVGIMECCLQQLIIYDAHIYLYWGGKEKSCKKVLLLLQPCVWVSTLLHHQQNTTIPLDTVVWNSHNVTVPVAMFHLLIINICLFVSLSRGCELYMAKSFNKNFGRGIFAGRSFKYNSLVEKCPTLLVHNDFVLQSQLGYFSYDSDFEDYAVLTFGAGMLYNSMNEKTVSYDWATKNVPPAHTVRDHVYTTYTDFAYTSEKTIRPGEEIYCYYGEKWFTDRDIDDLPNHRRNKTKYNMETLEQEGHCLTDIYFKPSKIPMAGQGVFTRKAHKAGEVVSISPVLVLSRRDLLDVSATTVLLNYCISQNNSDVALFPIGRAAMINHGASASNMKIQWHNWDDPSSSHPPSALDMDIFELMDLTYSALDIQYTATRDIAAGEELLLDYGHSWEASWGQYLDLSLTQSEAYREDVSKWNPETSPQPVRPQPPLFRSYIEAPRGLFPSHFEVPCIGFGCDGDNDMLVRDALRRVDLANAEIATAIKHAQDHFHSGLEKLGDNGEVIAVALADQ